MASKCQRSSRNLTWRFPNFLVRFKHFSLEVPSLFKRWWKGSFEREKHLKKTFQGPWVICRGANRNPSFFRQWGAWIFVRIITRGGSCTVGSWLWGILGGEPTTWYYRQNTVAARAVTSIWATAMITELKGQFIIQKKVLASEASIYLCVGLIYLPLLPRSVYYPRNQFDRLQITGVLSESLKFVMLLE